MQKNFKMCLYLGKGKGETCCLVNECNIKSAVNDSIFLIGK